MRTTYTKPNSYSQQSAKQYCDVVTELCDLLGISFDEWRALMFEAGYQWAIANAPDHSIAMTWLTDPNMGFWNEFLVDYINDDNQIMNIAIDEQAPIDIAQYLDYKAIYHLI